MSTVLETPCRVYRGSKNGAGYGWLNRHRMLLHRWVWEQVNGPIPPGVVIRHRCDNPPCFRYDHLVAGSMADNTADMMVRGRDGHGELRGLEHPRHVLTAEEVALIRTSPLTLWELARQLGVGFGTVQRCRTYESYKDLP